MVSKTEEEQVNRLENQVENGGGGAWEYLCLVRKLKLRRSDKVLKYGFSILNDPKKRSALGPEGIVSLFCSFFFAPNLSLKKDRDFGLWNARMLDLFINCEFVIVPEVSEPFFCVTFSCYVGKSRQKKFWVLTNSVTST